MASRANAALKPKRQVPARRRRGGQTTPDTQRTPATTTTAVAATAELLKPDKLVSRRRGGGHFSPANHAVLAPTTADSAATIHSVTPTSRLSSQNGGPARKWLKPESAMPARVAVKPKSLLPADRGKAKSRLGPGWLVPSRDLHSEIAHRARLIWAAQETRKRITNHAGALERDGFEAGWVDAITAGADPIINLEHTLEKSLVALVRQHPMAGFIERDCPGLGLGGFGRLLGCTGTLDNFANVAKLWAFLGMHVVGGRAPRRVKGTRSNWSRQGRVVCHQIGDAIVKLGRGQYHAAYAKKRAEYLARPRLGPSGCPFGHEHRGDEKREDAKGWKRKIGVDRVVQCVKTKDDGAESSAHVHMASMRYAVKELLKDLWVEWRRLPKGATC